MVQLQQTTQAQFILLPQQIALSNLPTPITRNLRKYLAPHTYQIKQNYKEEKSVVSGGL